MRRNDSDRIRDEYANARKLWRRNNTEAQIYQYELKTARVEAHTSIAIDVADLRELHSAVAGDNCLKSILGRSKNEYCDQESTVPRKSKNSVSFPNSQHAQ